MQPYLLAIFAFAAGLIGLFWKEKGKWISFIILIGIVVVTIWKQISADSSSEIARQEAARQDEIRARLTSELLDGYHQLSHFIFIADLKQDDSIEEASFVNAEKYFPLIHADGLEANSFKLHLVVNRDSTDIVMKLKGDSTTIYCDNLLIGKFERNSFWSSDVKTKHTFEKEETAPFCSYLLKFPVNPPELPVALTLPVMLQSMTKDKQVGYLEYEFETAPSQQEIAALRQSISENVTFGFKGYVTDNDSLGVAASDSMPADGFRPHIYTTLALGEFVINGTTVTFPLMVAGYPRLFFTETVPI